GTVALNIDASAVLNALTITGNAGGNTLTGTGFDDTINGGAGNDTLNGGDGNDNLTGGIGSDTFVFDLAPDAATNLDTITDFTHGVDHIALDGSIFPASSENEYETSFASGAGLTTASNTNIHVIYNTLTGTLYYDFDGLGGQAAIAIAQLSNKPALDFNDFQPSNVLFSSTSTVMGAGLLNLTLTGNENIDGTGNDLNNRIIGNIFNNVLDGGAGNDTLNGNTGIDTMLGGTGNDTYYVDNAADRVSELEDAGNDTIYSSFTYSLIDTDGSDPNGGNVENLILTGSFNINGTGNSLDNIINGNSGNNILDGGGGADTLAGGLGNDSYQNVTADTVIVENANEGVDSVSTTATSISLSENLENLTYTGSGNFTGIGNSSANSIVSGSGDDSLTGGAGNDTLDSGTGVDTLVGGTGDDTYILDSSLSDVLVENADEGTDSIILPSLTNGATYTLASNFENLTYVTGQVYLLNLNGNASDNLITIASGTVMSGTLHGGDGNDTIDGSGSYGVLELYGDSGDDRLIGTGYWNGSSGIFDLLDGGTGNDTMIGGSGYDVYIVDSVGDVVIEDDSYPGNLGTDTVKTTLGSYTLGAGVENLTFIGTGNFIGSGNTKDNILIAGSGNDTLDGGTGADSLTGGSGADVFIFSSISGGKDTISDFSSASGDYLMFSQTAMSALGNAGILGASHFESGAGLTAAATASGNIIYDTSSGNLYYDSDGLAGLSSVLIATLNGAPALTASDIHLTS
ncbi:MAG TPA: hypothetical protein VIE91_02425, partial [Methylophilaceae bacterium]